MDSKTIRKIVHLSKADLHIHSNYSDGRPTIEQILNYVETETDLDVIGITDHDVIKGAEEATNIAKTKKFHFDVVIGEEVTTKEGHILALYIKEAIKPGMSAEKTLAEIHRQGGVGIAPHPFQHSRMKHPNKAVMNGIGLTTLLKIKKHLDAVEIVNATPTLTNENIKAGFFNKTLLLRGETGSSDAHILDAIGKGYTLFEGKSAHDLKKALLLDQTKAASSRWAVFALLKYLFFFIPIGLRLAFYTVFHGNRGEGLVDNGDMLINIKYRRRDGRRED